MIAAILIGTFCAALLCADQARGADLAALVPDPEAHRIVDAMPPDEKRRAVAGLGGIVTSDDPRVARILCAISPWTTGTQDGDDALSARLWALMAAEPHAETEAFRFLDCAASNRRGGYRTVALDPMFAFRQVACSGQRMDSPDAPDPLTTIEGTLAFDRETRGWLGGDVATRGSFYPLRNAIRRANLHAARAVLAQEDGARSAALLDASAAASDALEELDAQPLKMTRNAWRTLDDLRFHAALYAWLADVPGNAAQDVLEGFLDPMPVLSDPRRREALTPEIEDAMPPDYVDYIYVERLLPGALLPDANAECRAWRRRSYHPADLATAVLECGQGGGLAAFDACMAGFEAEDWTLVFASARGTLTPSRRAAWLLTTKRFVAALDGVAKGEREREAVRAIGELVPEVLDGGFRIRAAGHMSTSERELLRPVFERVLIGGIAPVFQRPTTY